VLDSEDTFFGCKLKAHPWRPTLPVVLALTPANIVLHACPPMRMCHVR
jgi:hypothetical protein